MAGVNKTLVLDLGMQSLRLAEFCTAPGGKLKLLRGARREFLIDPALDTSRPDQARLALKEILKSWRTKSGKARVILPAHSVFTRVVPLEIPGGSPSQIAAMAGFEAQQNIPFPLEEVVWDYAVMGTLPNGSTNILFLAVKIDLIEALGESLREAGLSVESVTVSPLAIRDACQVLGETGCSDSLVLDFGARTTNMVAADPGVFFSRSIPSGGLAVTTTISKEIHVSLEEAENLKVTRGSVGLGPDAAAPHDPLDANLARITRQALIKTQADISRSISHYRSNMGGGDPQRILLSGGMAAMPFMSEFVRERFQKEPGFLGNELMSSGFLSVAEGAREFCEANLHNMAELAGGAMSLLGNRKHTSVSLLPPSLARRKSFLKKAPYLAAAALLFLSSLGAWSFFASRAAEATVSETAGLAQDVKSTESLDGKIKAIQRSRETLAKNASDLLSLILLRDAYPRIVAELAEAVPDRYLWITEITPDGVLETTKKTSGKAPSDSAVKAVVIKGFYLDNPRQASVVDDFVGRLQASAFFAIEDRNKVVTQRSSPNGEFWAYPFALRVPLRTPIPNLPPIQ